MNADLPSILLVEDDPGDVLLISEALAEQKVGNTLSVVSDCVMAMEFMSASTRGWSARNW
jgi:hypothetical protein